MKNISITLLAITLASFMGMTLGIVSIEVFGVLVMSTFMAFWLWFMSWLEAYLERKDLEAELVAVNSWRISKGYIRRTC